MQKKLYVQNNFQKKYNNTIVDRNLEKSFLVPN